MKWTLNTATYFGAEVSRPDRVGSNRIADSLYWLQAFQVAALRLLHTGTLWTEQKSWLGKFQRFRFLKLTQRSLSCRLWFPIPTTHYHTFQMKVWYKRLLCGEVIEVKDSDQVIFQEAIRHQLLLNHFILGSKIAGTEGNTKTRRSGVSGC